MNFALLCMLISSVILYINCKGYINKTTLQGTYLPRGGNNLNQSAISESPYSPDMSSLNTNSISICDIHNNESASLRLLNE